MRLSKTGPNSQFENHNYEAFSQNKLLTSGDIETEPGPHKLSPFKIIATPEILKDIESEPGPYKVPVNPDLIQKATSERKVYSNYHQSRIIQSGDVETEPGPYKHKKKPAPNIYTIMLKLMMLIIIINRLKTSQEDTEQIPKSPTIQSYGINMISQLLISRLKRNQKTLPQSKSDKAYLAILLILAGDIHLNPGPPKENTCLKCGQSTSRETGIVCETCGYWSHMQCTVENLNKSSNLSPNGKSFQWICSNVHCKPNHHPGKESKTEYPPNRYSLLQNYTQEKLFKAISKIPNKKVKACRGKAQGNKNKKCTTNDVNSHWKVLTKITSEDYIGRERCKACHSTVGSNHRSISCDQCLRLTHLKCSDMTVKVYNSNKNKTFPWVCNTCRQPEEEEETTDIKKLKPADMPISYDNFPKLKDGFLVLHYNCRSILNKIEEIFNICMNLKPEILCLTETWLDQSTPQTANIPQGYKILRRDRSDAYKQRYGKTNGGGTAILYREDIKVREIKLGVDHEETQWVEIKGKTNFILGVVYRAHYTDLLVETSEGIPLEKQLYEASIKTSRILVTGDFNCDTSKTDKDEKTERLEDMFKRYSMEQLIKKPTRISTTNTTTTIDHVWADCTTNLVKETGTIEGISDHTGQFIRINHTVGKPEPVKTRFRSYRNYNQDHFNEELQQKLDASEVDQLIENRELNKAMDTWTAVFRETAQKHAPIIEKTKKLKKEGIPWFGKELEQKIEQRNKKLQLHRLYGLHKDLNAVKKLTNEITHLKRKLKKKYYTQKIEEYEGEPKKIWRILRHVTQTTPDKSNIEPEFMDQNKANQFNSYFATIGTEIQKALGIKEKPCTTEGTGKFKFKQETKESIIKLIDRIKTDVATGTDEIDAKLIKDTKYTIAESLTKLINLSYSMSIFPNSMKIAIIKPLHKKNSIEDASNYRPLSILPVISKIFERSATDQIVEYLEQNRKLNSTQHAYRKGHSTQTCLMEIMNHIYTQKDKGKIIGIASLDLSKAFDSISHTHLLQKLNKLGLDEATILWCKSYLQDRKQKTKFKKFTSDEHNVTSGVPQGSILGPILFICFTNDMASNFEDCKIISYADDTQIIVTGTNKRQVKQKLEVLLKTAQSWYTRNSLMNNSTKTEILIIGKNKEKTQTYIEVMEEGKVKMLDTKKNIKVLGVYIDHDLNWNPQIQHVRKKATNSIRNLHRINQLIPLRHRKLLYNSLVASHYNYADTVWSGCGTTNEKKLQITQNYAARSILGIGKRTSATDALKTLQFLTLKEKRHLHEAVYVKKAMQNKLPLEIVEQYKNQLSKLNLRSSAKLTLNVPPHKTQQYQNSPMFRTIKSWNNTPADLRTDTTNTFKVKLQSHLLQETL